MRTFSACWNVYIAIVMGSSKSCKVCAMCTSFFGASPPSRAGPYIIQRSGEVANKCFNQAWTFIQCNVHPLPLDRFPQIAVWVQLRGSFRALFGEHDPLCAWLMQSWEEQEGREIYKVFACSCTDCNGTEAWGSIEWGHADSRNAPAGPDSPRRVFCGSHLGRVCCHPFTGLNTSIAFLEVV